MSAKLVWATLVKSGHLCESLGLNAVDGQNIGSFRGLDKSWLSCCNMNAIYNSLVIFGLHEATIVSCWTMAWTCTTAVINTQVLPYLLSWLIWSNLTKSILHEVRIFKQPESTAAAEAGIALPCKAGAHLLTLSFFPLSQLRAHPHQHTPTSSSSQSCFLSSLGRLFFKLNEIKRISIILLLETIPKKFRFDGIEESRDEVW